MRTEHRVCISCSRNATKKIKITIRKLKQFQNLQSISNSRNLIFPVQTCQGFRSLDRVSRVWAELPKFFEVWARCPKLRHANSILYGVSHRTLIIIYCREGNSSETKLQVRYLYFKSICLFKTLTSGIWHFLPCKVCFSALLYDIFGIFLLGCYNSLSN